MKHKKILFTTVMMMTLLLTSCNSTQNTISTQIENIQASENTTNTDENIILKDIEVNISDSELMNIDLNGTSATSTADGVTIENNTITITKSGNYNIQGTLDDGQIIIDTDDKGTVQLILNGVSISSSTTAPIFVRSAKQTVITLAENTTNTLTDPEKYVYEDSETDEPNATLFSKDELIIQGEGTLLVNANYNDGITSKDELVIYSGNITVNAVDDGIRGKDYLLIEGGNITITSKGDAFKADNEDKGTIVINEGNIVISSGDDAVHAEIYLEINGGDILITKSYEGLESKAITINGGNIDLTASDDGINVAGGVDESGGIKGLFGGDSASDEHQLIINGGTIVMDAQGDGLDSNGYITMNGGNVIVYGPTSGGNGPLDYNGDFTMVGGSLIAIGSSGMAQNIGNDSTQYGVLFGFDETLDAGTIFTLKDSSGKVVATVTGKKKFQSAVISNSSLKKGETYTSYIGDEVHETFTIESITTTVGTIGRGMGGGGDRGERTGGFGGRGGERPQREEGETPTEMGEDFETIRTIMDKQRNEETLTGEETTLLEEMQKNMPQKEDEGEAPEIK